MKILDGLLEDGQSVRIQTDDLARLTIVAAMTVIRPTPRKDTLIGGYATGEVMVQPTASNSPFEYRRDGRCN
jgi:hypothetical protein